MERKPRTLLIFADFLLFFASSFAFWRTYVDWDHPALAVFLSVLAAVFFGGVCLLWGMSREEDFLKQTKKAILCAAIPTAFHLFVTYLFVVTVNHNGGHASEAVQDSFYVLMPLFFVLALCALVSERTKERKWLWRLIFVLQGVIFILVFSLCVLLRENGYADDFRNARFDHYRDNVVLYDVKYGKDERQTLNLFIPKGADGTYGLVLYIHGGGWIAGSKGYYNPNLAETTARGYVGAALNYHYIDGEHSLDDILEDISLALSKIKDTCEKHGVTLSKVLLTGASAGGHLSLQYGYQMADVSPVPIGCIVSYCGPTDLTDEGYYHDNLLGTPERVCDLFSDLTGTRIEPEALEERFPDLLLASPISYVDETCVPTVICHGMVDQLVPYGNALDLDAKLTEYGVEHLLIPYPHSGHGLEADPEASALAEKTFWDYASRFLR